MNDQKINPLEDCLEIRYNQTDTLSTGGHRFSAGVPLSDVCMLGRRPDNEAYETFCNAFKGNDYGIHSLEPGDFRYVSDLNTWAHIPDPYKSIEQNMDANVEGILFLNSGYDFDSTRRENSNRSVKDFFRIDSGGHPDLFGMLNQHNRRDDDGRTIFNANFDENGKMIERNSYTPAQMRSARIPKSGQWLTILYPEAYERAFDEPSNKYILNEKTGYESIDEASWLGLKEWNGFEWSAGKISANGRIDEYPGNGEPFNKKPFNKAESATLITITKNGKWTVGGSGGDTALGNYIQLWDLEALYKIPGGKDITAEIQDEIIESRPENIEGLQILIGTKIGRIPGMTPPYGHVTEVTGVIEYNYLTDIEGMWGL